MSPVAIVHNIPISYKHLLFSELRRRNVDFEVLFLASGSADRIEVPDLATAEYRSRIGFHGRYEALPRWRTVRFVWRSLTEIRPSLVIISGWCDFGAWTSKIWSVLHGRPHILWAESNHFDHPRVRWKELIKSIFLRGFSAAQVYGISHTDYLAKLGFDSRKIWLKRAVADVNLFKLPIHPVPRNDSRKVILFVGRLAPEKNLEFVLEAMHRLSIGVRQRLLLRIVGYGPLESALRQKAESLGLNDVVEFAGPRKHGQLPDEYHAADVLLLPSISEPWGLTVNEGMLCGLPAIVSDRCGCARDLVRPDTGWLFHCTDSAGFVLILEEIARMPIDDLRKIGESAAAVSSQYSPENCARIVSDCVDATLVASAHG